MRAARASRGQRACCRGPGYGARMAFERSAAWRRRMWSANPLPTALSRWAAVERGRAASLARELGVRRELVWFWAWQVENPPLWAALAVEVLTKGEVPAQSWLLTRCSAQQVRTSTASQQDKRRVAARVSRGLSLALRRKTPLYDKGAKLPKWLREMVKNMSREESGPLFQVARHLSAKTHVMRVKSRQYAMHAGSCEERDLLGPSVPVVTEYFLVDGITRFRFRLARDSAEYALWWVEQPGPLEARRLFPGPPCVDFNRSQWELKEIPRNVEKSSRTYKATVLEKDQATDQDQEREGSGP